MSTAMNTELTVAAWPGLVPRLLRSNVGGETHATPAAYARSIGRFGVDPTSGPDLADVVVAQRERAKTLTEMAANSLYFYQDFAAYDDQAAAKHLTADAAGPLAVLRERLADLGTWSAPAIHMAVVDAAETLGVKLGKLAQPVRVAVCGTAVSPPIDVTLELLGRERSLARLERAIAWAGKRAEA